MGNLQVKNFPDELHEVLRERARKQGVTLSELVSQVLRREASKPSVEEWLAELDKVPVREKDIDIEKLMDEIRGPWPEPDDAGR